MDFIWRENSIENGFLSRKLKKRSMPNLFVMLAVGSINSECEFVLQCFCFLESFKLFKQLKFKILYSKIKDFFNLSFFCVFSNFFKKNIFCAGCKINLRSKYFTLQNIFKNTSFCQSTAALINFFFQQNIF